MSLLNDTAVFGAPPHNCCGMARDCRIPFDAKIGSCKTAQSIILGAIMLLRACLGICDGEMFELRGGARRTLPLAWEEKSVL